MQCVAVNWRQTFRKIYWLVALQQGLLASVVERTARVNMCLFYVQRLAYNVSGQLYEEDGDAAQRKWYTDGDVD